MHNIVKHFNKQTGDTIVEVMLAIIVIGGTLGGAFAIANRSTKTTQANYERYQAQVIANNQAELLKQYMKKTVNHDSFNNTSGNQCINDANGEPKAGVYCERPNVPYVVDVQCIDEPIATKCSNSSTYNNYKIRVEWDSLNGGKDNVELFYGV